MIKVNDKKIPLSCFGDGSLKCETPQPNYLDLIPSITSNAVAKITWCYDDDLELFAVVCLTRHIQDNWGQQVELVMPYIPHARQDRNVSNRLFTLKYFAEIINGLNFVKVKVLDPHSDVATALINRIELMPMPLQISLGEVGTVMFPDNGAAKKYSEFYKLEECDNPFIIGNKKRNHEGKIVSYDLMNFVEGTENVIIRDDICSYGGTFVAAAKELRARGVKDITLFVSHCENNILKGEVFEWIDRVFTTDSICTVTHPKLIVQNAYRSI